MRIPDNPGYPVDQRFYLAFRGRQLINISASNRCSLFPTHAGKVGRIGVGECEVAGSGIGVGSVDVRASPVEAAVKGGVAGVGPASLVGRKRSLGAGGRLGQVGPSAVSVASCAERLPRRCTPRDVGLGRGRWWGCRG